MKKRIFLTILIFSFLLLGSSSILAMVVTKEYIVCESNATYYKGEEKLQFEEPCFTYNSKTYVPVRQLCDYLNIPIIWNGEKNQIEIDSYHKIVSTGKMPNTNVLSDGVVPDKESALMIGKIILESTVGESMEYQDGEYYYCLNGYYYEPLNCWMIQQTCLKNNQPFQGGNNTNDYSIQINKSTGEVQFINTFSDLKQRVEQYKERYDK